MIGVSASMTEKRPTRQGRLYRWYVRHVYANQNSSPDVRRAVKKLVTELPSTGVALNVGSGITDLPGVVSLDFFAGPGVAVRGDAMALPVRSESCDLLLSQEVLEHLPDPDAAVRELVRVLRPGGRLYCQTPFIIGYHPCPDDFWRFTLSGVRHLLERHGLVIDSDGISVGAGTAVYRVLVEAAASLAASAHPRTYLATKAFAAAVLFPVKWLDRLVQRSPQATRAAAGFYVIARKPQATRAA